MSKQQRDQRKKKKREEVRKRRLAKERANLASRGRDDGFIEHIFDLMKRKDYDRAREMLLQYVEKFPKIARPYGVLASVCGRMGDAPGMFWAADRLLKVGQKTTEDFSLYRMACTINVLPATMCGCIEQMRKHRVPFDDERDTKDFDIMRAEMIAAFKSDAVLAGDDLTPYSDDQILELMQWHEQSRLYLGSQRFDEAIELCDRLIKHFPFFRSAYNNKALAIMYDRGPDEAEPFLRQALEHHPDNLFAIAFKIHQLALLGRHEDLAVWSDRLAAVPLIFPNKQDYFTGKIEAFAWADDLDRIIETYEAGVKEMGDEWDVDIPACASATHYAAVAHARLGHTETAIELWESLSEEDLPEYITENLEDIRKPVGERNGPWFFSLNHWMPTRFFTMLREIGHKARLDDYDEEEQKIIIERRMLPFFTKAFATWPSLERTLIEMLKRGGPESRHWVRMFISQRKTPEFIAALLDFTMGQSGSDECRNGFMQELSRAQALKPGPLRMYRDGEVVEYRISGIEIHWEAKKANPPLSSEGARKFLQAHELSKKGELEKALEILIDLNAKEPGRPSILYNIATYYLALGDEDVYDETIDKIVEDFPDYFFGKVALAKRLIWQSKLDEAWDTLKPLHDLQRMHGSECTALFGTMVMYHLAKDEMESAKSIHQSGVALCGDMFPSLEQFQRELDRNPTDKYGTRTCDP